MVQRILRMIYSLLFWAMCVSYVRAKINCGTATINGLESLRCVSSEGHVVNFEGMKGYLYWTLKSNETEIVLTYCGLNSIHPTSFENLPYLKKIYMSYNAISQLKYNHDLAHLEFLRLSDNNVNKIDDDFFSHFPKLKYLDLSNNNFKGDSLKRAMFSGLSNLAKLDMSGNDMSAAPSDLLLDLSNLTTLGQVGCSLLDVPKFAINSNMSSLTELNLSLNLITKLDADTFAYLVNLKILSLNDNRINFIHEHLFYPLQSLQELYLNNNKIKHIPVNLFHGLFALKEIDLARNQIEFVAEDVFQSLDLNILDLSHNRFSYLPKDFISKLQGRSSKSVVRRFLFDENPWQCGCLHELILEAKKLGVKYDIARYNGQYPVCVTVNYFKCIRFVDIQTKYDSITNH